VTEDLQPPVIQPIRLRFPPLFLGPDLKRRVKHIYCLVREHDWDMKTPPMKCSRCGTTEVLIGGVNA
jgi:hypothetical protein